ncbi:MAG: hypothetical protein WC211_00670 [Dehalococcoidia bacterium]
MGTDKWTIDGVTSEASPTVGGMYDVNHSRKGRFRARALAVRGEWLDVEIVSGMARAALRGNEREAGEEVTLRNTHAALTTVTS